MMRHWAISNATRRVAPLFTSIFTEKCAKFVGKMFDVCTFFALRLEMRFRNLLNIIGNSI